MIAQAVNGSEGQLRQRHDALPESHAIQSADVDLLQNKSRRRHQFGFHTPVRANEEHFVAPGPEFPRHRQGGNDVAPGAAAGEEEGGGGQGPGAGV